MKFIRTISYRYDCRFVDKSDWISTLSFTREWSIDEILLENNLWVLNQTVYLTFELSNYFRNIDKLNWRVSVFLWKFHLRLLRIEIIKVHRSIGQWFAMKLYERFRFLQLKLHEAGWVQSKRIEIGQVSSRECDLRRDSVDWSTSFDVLSIDNSTVYRWK